MIYNQYVLVFFHLARYIYFFFKNSGYSVHLLLFTTWFTIEEYIVIIYPGQ